MYAASNTTMYANQLTQDRAAELRASYGNYHAYGNQPALQPSARRLRAASIGALATATFGLLGLPLIPAVLLALYVLRNTTPDAAPTEERTRGIAVIALSVTFVTLGVLTLGWFLGTLR